MSHTTELIRALSKADLIDVVNDTLIYEGFFKPGKTNSAQAVCRIVRKQQTGTVWATMYADGDLEFDNIWNNRAALAYSHLTK
jgi:hypothetical protein